MSPQSTLFDEAAVSNPNANEVWKRKEVDRLLELYLSGMTPAHIAVKMGRNPKAVTRKLQEYIYNERDRVVNYVPRRRTSRAKQRMTKNELQIIQECRKKNVAAEHIARVLQRGLAEIDGGEVSTRFEFETMRKLATGVDLVLAYRYLYYVRGISIMSDKDYDDIEKEEMEFGNGGKILSELVGSDSEEDYPHHIRALALYLCFKYCKKGEKVKPFERK